MIIKSTDIQGALRQRRRLAQPPLRNSQRGFLLNPFRFPAPITTDPYWANVLVLLHGDGVNGGTTITDSSVHNTIYGAGGNAQTSTTQVKYGTASLKFDGTGDYINNSGYSYGINPFAGDATIEFWAYYPDSGGNQCICELWQTTNDRANITLLAGAIVLYTQTTALGGAVRITTPAPAINTWHHIAVVKSGATTTMYVNGVSVGTTATTAFPVASFVVSLGAGGGGASSYNGFIDDLRITVGTARYIGDFSPPTAAFPNSGIGYRYYRTLITANRGSVDFTGFAELDLAAGANNTGTQLLTSANKTSLSVSTTQGSLANSQDTLTDGAAAGTGSKWLSSYQAGGPHWVQMDFGVGTVLGSYTMAVDSDADNIRPRDWLFQGSNNGSTWTTLDVVSGKTWTNNEFYTRDVVTGAAMPWDPSKKGANVTLSDSSRTSSMNNTAHTVLSVTGHSNTGDWYAEVIPQGGDTSWRIGISKTTVNLTNSVGYDSDSYGHISFNGNKTNSNGSTTYGASWNTAGTVIGIRLNAGVLTFYKNGVSQGVAYSGLGAGPWYVAFSANGSFNGAQSSSINTGQAAFAYPVAGAAAWG